LLYYFIQKFKKNQKFEQKSIFSGWLFLFLFHKNILLYITSFIFFKLSQLQTTISPYFLKNKNLITIFYQIFIFYAIFPYIYSSFFILSNIFLVNFKPLHRKRSPSPDREEIFAQKFHVFLYFSPLLGGGGCKPEGVERIMVRFEEKVF